VVAPAVGQYLATIERHLPELAAAKQRLISAEKALKAHRQDRGHSM
jgi:hypothetical protein